LGYGVSTLASIIGAFSSRGMRVVVIGDTVVHLAVRSKTFPGDLDLFPLEPSPRLEEEAYRRLAEEEGWDFSYTDLGTPRLVARTSEGDVVVEVYDNIYDFYIPTEILEGASGKMIGGVELLLIAPEDYVVLKARQGSGEALEKVRWVASLASKGKLRLDARRIRRNLELFEDSEVIERRLKDSGIRI
jgi:predicted nucleotidyltransferase